jgi:leucyl-tRNA synthetase
MYDYKNYEKKWQDKWAEQKIGLVQRDEKKSKYFIIWAYLTVSGFHHIGHMRGFSYADSIARYKRMLGYNVLLPAGGHATGNGAVSKSLKVVANHKETIDYYKSYGLNDGDIESLKTPEGFVDFFSKKYIEDYKNFGFIGDWRRFTVTTNKDYNKFIEWQFKKLKEMNLLVQKPYYATACVSCGPVAVDPSEMDLSKGGSAQKNEYTIIKLNYKEDNQYIVVATLRPETMYGQTNVWLDCNINYVKIKVGNEVWIASSEFAEKINYQKDETIEVIGQVSGKELVGTYCRAPSIEREIIILPSKFCDPNVGTGIVTSVPSDAPADWIGLYDLQSNKKLCEKYGLDFETIKNIKPISIIRSKGYGDYPAIEICERLGINSQDDTEKLENAKKEIYKTGFHTGIMKEICGPYSGLKVEEAKEKIKSDLIKNNSADIFYGLSEEVVCRCGEPVVIKKINDQWFVRYSDEKLTNNTIEYTKNMLIKPEQFQKNLPNILNWFDDRACARQGKWLGTKLPFDQTYTVEAISDSTLYPIFYIVSLYTNSRQIKNQQLTEEFFDYVYLGKGNIKEVSKKTTVSVNLLDNIRKDVEYWYPLDINLGGKEHQTVHFPVFLMNHVGILPKNMWPKGIFVNWWVTSKGGKISKSKGGVSAVNDEAERYSIDAMRLFYANVANTFTDIAFDQEDLIKYKQRLEKIFSFIEEIIEKQKNNNLDNLEINDLDKWLESKFNNRLKTIRESMDNIEFKFTTDEIYYNFYNDLMWYINRGGNNQNILIPIIKKWILTFGLFTPHMAEELNEKIGNSDLIALSEFPKVEENKIRNDLELNEQNIEKMSADIRKVIELSNIEKINIIKIYISSKELYNYYKDLNSKWTEINKISLKNNTKPNIKEIIEFMNSKYSSKIKENSKNIMSFIKKDKNFMDLTLDQDKEYNLWNNVKPFLESVFSTNVQIIRAEEDIDNIKAKQASPGKIGIIVE